MKSAILQYVDVDLQVNPSAFHLVQPFSLAFLLVFCMWSAPQSTPQATTTKTQFVAQVSIIHGSRRHIGAAKSLCRLRRTGRARALQVSHAPLSPAVALQVTRQLQAHSHCRPRYIRPLLLSHPPEETGRAFSFADPNQARCFVGWWLSTRVLNDDAPARIV